MRHITIIVLFFAVLKQVNATPQIPDYLIYEGDTIPIFSNPLEIYLEKNNLKNIDRGCNSSACNRGYIAFWEIINNKLYLNKIERCGIIASAGVYTGLECDSNSTSPVINYFEKEFNAQKVLASWYSDSLIAPRGRLIEYIHGGYLSKYEKELHLLFKCGELIGENIVANTIKPELYMEYNVRLVQDTISHYLSKLDWKYLSGELFCDDSYFFTVNIRGRISKVKYETRLDSQWEIFWYSFNDFGCKRKLKKSLKNLHFSPYLKGKSKKIVVQLYIGFDNEKLWFEY